jgi:hypothetical protein
MRLVQINVPRPAAAFRANQPVDEVAKLAIAVLLAEKLQARGADGRLPAAVDLQPSAGKLGKLEPSRNFHTVRTFDFHENIMRTSLRASQAHTSIVQGPARCDIPAHV